MKPIVFKCKVLLECESTSYELRVYPIASCETARLQVASYEPASDQV